MWTDVVERVAENIEREIPTIRAAMWTAVGFIAAASVSVVVFVIHAW